MKCTVNRDYIISEIKNNVENEINKSNLFNKEDDNFIPKSYNSDYQSVINKVNTSYGEQMILPIDSFEDTFAIGEPSDKLVSRYMEELETSRDEFINYYNNGFRDRPDHKDWYVTEHLDIVSSIVDDLRSKYGGDKRILDLMVWTHDLAKALNNETLSHRETIEPILKEKGVDEYTINTIINNIELMDKVKKEKIKNLPIEVKILSTADALSHYSDNFLNIYSTITSSESMDSIQESNRKKIQKDQNKILLPEFSLDDIQITYEGRNTKVTGSANTYINTLIQSPIKPGIKELFDSNPTLANQVYEALGFKQNKIDLKPYALDVWGKVPNQRGDNRFVDKEQYSVKINTENKGIDVRLTVYFDKDTNTAFVSNIENFENEVTHKDKKGLGKKAFIEANKLIISKGFVPVIDNLVSGFGYDMLSKLEKEGFLVKNLDKIKGETNYENIKYKESPFSFTDKIYQDQITPQQKQQAQQLYSQYLQQNPNGSIEQFKSWVEEFNRNNKKLNSNIQIFNQNQSANFNSSNLKNDDLALMLFNQALGLNISSISQLTWDNIKDNIFFEKEDGSLGVKNLAFTSGGFLKTSKPTINDFINQKGLFPDYKVFIGESVIYPNVFETLEENEIIKQAIFDNLFNLSGAFEQVKKELNNHSPETFIIETPQGKFTFPKRFAAGFWNIATKVELLLKENQSTYIQDYLTNKRKREEVVKDGKKIKPIITQTLTVNDTIVQNAIGLIGNPIIENAIKNNTSVKIQVFSNAEYSEDGIAGWYLPASNTIYLHESMLNPKHLSEGLPLIAHELIHSVTEQALQFDKNFQKDIQSLLDSVKNQSQIKDFYGFKNTSEFLSEAFSSKEFRELLNTTKFSNTEKISVWQKFINSILRLFGKSVKYTEKTNITNAEQILNNLINQHSYKIGYVKSTISDKLNTNISLSDFISQKSQEKLNAIQEIFNQNPELSKIGDVFSYASYLDTIFPDSKVKEIVYHGSHISNIEKFDFSKQRTSLTGYLPKGGYFTSEKAVANSYSDKKGKIYSAILNLKNPRIIQGNEDYNDISRTLQKEAGVYKKQGITNKEITDALNNLNEQIVRNNDGVVLLNIKDSATSSEFTPIYGYGELSYNEDNENTYVVFEPEQIHILGSKQDIEGFKKFVQSTSSEGISNKVTENKNTPSVNYTFKIVKAITDNIDKISQWEKKITDPSILWEKIQKDLGIPSNQVELLKKQEGNNIEEKLTNFIANYSYTIQINTSKDFNKDGAKYFNSFDLNNKRYSRGMDNEIGQFYQYYDLSEKKFVDITQQQYEEAVNEAKIEDKEFNTEYYSNLTVPGGTNYTENEISTPLITPSIKGHAQFATDNGIGWFRSDDKLVQTTQQIDEDSKRQLAARNRLRALEGQEPLTELPTSKYISTTGTKTKTRRILEVQSDLFQKGRDNKLLQQSNNRILVSGEYNENNKDFQLGDYQYSGVEIQSEYGSFIKRNIKTNSVVENISKQEFENAVKEFEKDIKSNENEFLQLLNKDNNWVTFFIKSIIQDSAKKGYEKVLFPRLDTIIQIESQGKWKTYKEAEKAMKDDRWEDIDIEYRQVLQEQQEEYSKNPTEKLKQLIIESKERIAAHQPKLLNTANFYEFELANRLDDIAGGNKNNRAKGIWAINQITDEYGNTWYEIKIASKPEKIYLSASTLTKDQIEELYESMPEGPSKIAFRSNPEKALQEFSDQLHDPNSRNTAIRTYGDKVSELAVQRYPSKKLSGPILSTEKVEIFQDLQNMGIVGTTPVVTGGREYYDINPEDIPILKIVMQKKGIDWLQIVGDKVTFGTVDPKSPVNQEVNPGILSSKAGTITKRKVLSFLEKIGFTNIQTVSELTYKGKKIEGSAYIDFIKGVMQIKEGMEDYTLPEESMHILVELIKQSRPEIYAQLKKDIINYNLYREVLNSPEYSSNPFYLTEDGKKDFDKIKDEAIAKLLAEFMIGQLEETSVKTEKVFNFWQAIVKWIQELFGAYKNPFEEALSLMDEPIGRYEDILSDDIWLSASTLEEINERNQESKKVWEKIKNKSENENISKLGSTYYKDGKQINYTEDELNNMDESTLRTIISGLGITPKQNDKKDLIGIIKAAQTKRVTDLTSAYYSKIFKGRNFDEALEDLYEQSRQDGDYIHEVMENIIDSWIDPQTGLLRKNQKPLTFPLEGNPLAGAPVRILSAHIRDLMASYKEGTRFLTEQVVNDAEKNIVGTIDFLAVLPDGSVDILDWKSMLIQDNEGAKDYKREGIYLQMNEYKRILKDAYNIENFGKIRAIPIRKNYIKDKDTEEYRLDPKNPIQIGNVNASKIKQEEKYLRPIISTEESTGSKEKDDIIRKLHNLYEIYVNQRNFEKNREVLNDLQDAIYELRVTDNALQLIKYFTDLEKQIKQITDNKEKITDVSESLAMANFYIDTIDKMVSPVIDMLRKSSVKKEHFENLKDKSYELSDQKVKLLELRDELLDKKAKEKGIFNLLLPEKLVNVAAKIFRNIGSQNMATARYAYELVKSSYQRISLETDNEIKKLKDLKYNIDQWMKENNISSKEMISKLVNLETGRIHAKIKKDFYKKRDEVRRSRDKKLILQFINDNYDIDQYKTWYAEQLEKLKEKHKNTQYSTNKTEDNKIKKRALSQFKNNYDINTNPALAFGSHNKYIWSKGLKEEKWYSDEYLAIRSNKALLDMYEYMIEKNNELIEIGALDEYKASTFFPNVRKSIYDILSIEDSNFLSKVADIGVQHYKNWKSSISIEDYEFNYQGMRDPLTGEPMGRRMVNFLSEIKGNEKSFDIFTVYGLMSKEIAKEKYLQENDETLRALLKLEQSKKTILQNKLGVIATKGDNTPEVSTQTGLNAPVLEKFIKAVVEGEKLQFTEDNVVSFKLREKWNNSKLGKLYKFNIKDGPTNVSSIKFVLWLNQINQKRILGVNMASAISNLFGGTYAANKLYQKYASKKDLHQAWLKLTSGAFYQSDEMKKNAALVDYFLPLLDDRQNFKASQLSVNSAAEILSNDWLMSPMRKSSEIAQLNIFFAIIENTGVIDGKIVNLRDAAAKDENYRKRFDFSPEERKRLEQEFEDRIKQYKEKYALNKIAEFKTIKEGGKDKVIIEIPGISRDSEEVNNLRDLVQTMSKDALGEVDEFDLANYKYNLYWRLFMTFKNWIPRQADVRWGEFRLDQAHNSYEYGRFRMLWRSLGDNLGRSMVRVVPLVNMMVGKEDLIKKAKEVYKEKVEQEKLLGSYNHEKFITEDEFIEKFIQGVNSSFAEVRTLLIMSAILFSGIFAADGDDDPKERSFKTLVRRQLNKLIDEVGFFYSPKNGIDILGNSAPIMGLIKDSYYLFSNLGSEVFGFTLENIGFEDQGESMREKAKPLKYTFKILPAFKEVLTYLPAINEDMAKEWGVKITDQRSR